MSSDAVPRPAARAAEGKQRLQQFCKRVIDIFGSLFCMICASPLFLAIAIAIKLDDRGPLIHRRRVVCAKGEFDAYKFRSMRVDADRILESDPELKALFEQNFKIKSDPRITRVGAFLRKYSLDEIPQFFNILFGEMSLVGPRMITRAELEKYGAARERLLSTKPGLTGYWQVNGRQTVDYADRVRMDMFYIDHWSVWLDLQILLKTPGSVIKAKGSY